MKPRKDSADSGAGSGCMARLVRCSSFSVLHGKRSAVGRDRIDGGTDTRSICHDAGWGVNQSAKSKRVKMRLRYAWVELKVTCDLVYRESLICIKEMKEDAAAIIVQPIIIAGRITHLTAQLFVLGFKLRNAERRIIKLLVEQRDLRGQKVDNVLAESRCCGDSKNVFGGIAQVHIDSSTNVKVHTPLPASASDETGVKP